MSPREDHRSLLSTLTDGELLDFWRDGNLAELARRLSRIQAVLIEIRRRAAGADPTPELLEAFDSSRSDLLAQVRQLEQLLTLTRAAAQDMPSADPCVVGVQR